MDRQFASFRFFCQRAPFQRWGLTGGILAIAVGLSGCQGNPALENRLAANPSLANSPAPEVPETPISPDPNPVPSPDLSPTPTPSPSPTVADNLPFSDLTGLPETAIAHIQDLATLGIITAETDQKFAPQDPITRAEFSRWLVQANNLFFAADSTKQIRLGAPNRPPVFKDVPNTHPDFASIQGLAEAGLIPSPLTNDPNASHFRPDAPLTREGLLLWKVPVDYRSALPKATLDNIKETWGFQDAAKITPGAWPALYADFQSGDRSNIRRMLGFVTLFQPQRSVTRSEAASALWYLGTQTEGLSAPEVQSPSAPSPSP